MLKYSGKQQLIDWKPLKSKKQKMQFENSKIRLEKFKQKKNDNEIMKISEKINVERNVEIETPK
jgi:hypothetical protein